MPKIITEDMIEKAAIDLLLSEYPSHKGSEKFSALKIKQVPNLSKNFNKGGFILFWSACFFASKSLLAAF